MDIRKVLVLRGPNYWANFPVLEAWVDLGPLKDSPSDSLPGFNERLMAWLPSMIEHRCSIGERGGFFERLRRGTYQGHILEHVALELQSLAGDEVGFGRTRETAEEGVYKVAWNSLKKRSAKHRSKWLAICALPQSTISRSTWPRRSLNSARSHGAPAWDPARSRSFARPLPAESRLGDSIRAVSCNSDMAPKPGESSPPSPTAQARSRNRLPKTRN